MIVRLLRRLRCRHAIAALDQHRGLVCDHCGRALPTTVENVEMARRRWGDKAAWAVQMLGHLEEHDKGDADPEHMVLRHEAEAILRQAMQPRCA